MKTNAQLRPDTSAFDAAAVAIYWFDSSGRVVYANGAFCMSFGIEPEKLPGLTIFDFCIDISKEDFRKIWGQLENKGSLGFRSTHRRETGGPVNRKFFVYSFRSGETKIACAAEADAFERADSDEQHRYFIHQNLIAAAISNSEKIWLDVNDKACELLGYTRDELLGNSWMDSTYPDDQGESAAFFADLLTGKRNTFSQIKRHTRKDGEIVACEIHVQCFPHDDGQPDLFVSLWTDVNDRVKANKVLRQRDERLRQAAQMARLGFFVRNPQTGRCESCSEAFADLVDMTPDEYIAFDLKGQGIHSLIHPDDRALYRTKMAQLRSGKRIEYEYRLLSPSGRMRYVREISQPDYDEACNIALEIGSALDITDIREAEIHLRQAQKMNAIGRLTGGIAHDFNNALAIISGNLELALKADRSADAHALIAGAIKAANQGATLIHSLLAFARLQPLVPETVDIKQLLKVMDDKLRRTLGKGIEFELVTETRLWDCLIDPHQLENVVLNLAINGRDAMPESGKLTIEASNAPLDDEYAATVAETEPGEYVCLAVTDSGTGMTDDVADQAFEPFFTTKSAGQGTGLGLSMAHGFVKQSSGHIRICSEIGEGTTIKIYLPRSDDKTTRKTAANARRQVPNVQGELVLVVEDNTDLRSVVCNQLKSLGYGFVVAEDAATAVVELENNALIEVLLTDVVLPGGTNGVELAQQASTLRPALPVVFMSGYTEVALIHKGRIDNIAIFLQKPFRRADLSRAINEALDA